MLRVSLSVLCFGVASLSHAAPAYLDCHVSTKAEHKYFSVKLDESSGKITHTWSDGGAFNAEGFFAAETISYQQISILGGVKITMKYQIDRSTLDAKEESTVESADRQYASEVPPSTEILKGKCKLVEVTKRKI